MHPSYTRQHETTWDAHHPLRPPVHHFVRIIAALDGAQNAVMIKEIDVDMRGSQTHEHLNVVTTCRKLL